MSANLLHVTDESFESEVIKSEQPVLVDYWAEWCGPCKMIAPILDEVAESYSDKVKIAKVDVDQNAQISAKYNIRGIPTLMLFREGQIIATHTGALNKTQLTDFIDSNLFKYNLLVDEKTILCYCKFKLCHAFVPINY